VRLALHLLRLHHGGVDGEADLLLSVGVSLLLRCREGTPHFHHLVP
jgi:hypothetical protein